MSAYAAQYLNLLNQLADQQSQRLRDVASARAAAQMASAQAWGNLPLQLTAIGNQAFDNYQGQKRLDLQEQRYNQMAEMQDEQNRIAAQRQAEIERKNAEAERMAAQETRRKAALETAQKMLPGMVGSIDEAKISRENYQRLLPVIRGMSRTITEATGGVFPDIEYPDEPDADTFPTLDQLSAAIKSQMGESKLMSMSPGSVAFDPVKRQPVYSVPFAPKTPTVGSAEWMMNAPPEQLRELGRRQDIVNPPRAAASGGGAASDTVASDSQEMAELLVSGHAVPAQLSKFGGAYNKAIAAANRLSKERTGKPYNPAKAGVEYQAAMRFVSSLNGPQMVRFKGLAQSVVNTIDEVETLAKELDQSGLTALNAAQLAAKLKVFGNTQQGQLVARYLGAVNTLKEEFANLVNGGYAPTEDAFNLANKQINENYGVKAMTASLNEVKRLINFRVNAFDQVSPMGVSANNPAISGLGQAPPPQAQMPVSQEFWGVTSGGQRVRFPSQSALDAAVSGGRVTPEQSGGITTYVWNPNTRKVEPKR